MCIAMMLPSDKRFLLQLRNGTATARDSAMELIGFVFVWALAGGVLQAFDAYVPSIGNFFGCMPSSIIMGANVTVLTL